MILFYVILLVSSYFLNFERKGEVSFHRQKETQKVLFIVLFFWGVEEECGINFCRS